MALAFPKGTPKPPTSIFPHSEETETGQGKERIGQATVIVSLDGTGDTDDIQDAIDLLPPTGGVVFIKEGDYDITSTISVPSNTTLGGVGNATILRQNATFADTTEMIECDSVQNVILENFRMIGNADDSSNYDMIELKNSGIIRVENITIEGCAVGIGIQSRGLGASEGKHVITNCTIDGAATVFFKGIEVFSNGVIISNNQIKNCTTDGIDVDSGINVVIIGNVITGNSGKGVSLQGALGGDATNQKAIVTGNILNSNGNDGLSIDRYHHTTITGNLMMDNGAYGVDITANADRNIISSNVITGNTTGQFRDAGANTLPNGALGTTNLAQDDLNIIA